MMGELKDAYFSKPARTMTVSGLQPRQIPPFVNDMGGSDESLEDRLADLEARVERIERLLNHKGA